MLHFNLHSALNQYFFIGCKTFTRHELLAYGGMDYVRVDNCLQAWAARGLIKLLKPLHNAEDSEITVRMLAPIGDFDLTEDSSYGLVTHSPELMVVQDEGLLAYLTCDLPLGYPFDTSISQLLLIRIRSHHRDELLHQQFRFLSMADQFIATHPWLTYLAARKHEAVMAVMPGDCELSADFTSSKIARECAVKSKTMRSLARVELDPFTARDCERMILLQIEALRISVAKQSVEAALTDGISSVGPLIPPPLPFTIRISWKLLTLLLFLVITSTALVITGNIVLGAATIGMGITLGIVQTTKFLSSRRSNLTSLQVAHESWLKKHRHFRECRDSLHLVSALIGLTRVEALNDLRRTLEKLNALTSERCVLEATYVAPYGCSSVDWRPQLIRQNHPEPIR